MPGRDTHAHCGADTGCHCGSGRLRTLFGGRIDMIESRLDVPTSAARSFEDAAASRVAASEAGDSRRGARNTNSVDLTTLPTIPHFGPSTNAKRWHGAPSSARESEIALVGTRRRVLECPESDPEIRQRGFPRKTGPDSLHRRRSRACSRVLQFRSDGPPGQVPPSISPVFRGKLPEM